MNPTQNNTLPKNSTVQPQVILDEEQQKRKVAKETWQSNIASGVDQAKKTGWANTAVAPVKKYFKGPYGDDRSMYGADKSMNMAQREYIDQVGTDDTSGFEHFLYKYVSPGYDPENKGGRGERLVNPDGLFYASGGGTQEERDQGRIVSERIRSFNPKVDPVTGIVNFEKKMTKEEVLDIMKSIPNSSQSITSGTVMKALEDSLNAKKKFQEYSDYTSTRDHFAEMAETLDDQQKKYIADTYFGGKDFQSIVDTKKAQGMDMNDDLAYMGIDTWHNSRAENSAIAKGERNSKIAELAEGETEKRMVGIQGSEAAQKAIRSLILDEEKKNAVKKMNKAEMAFQSQQQKMREEYEKRNIQNYIQKNPEMDDRALSDLMKSEGVDISKLNITSNRNEMKRLGYRDPTDQNKVFEKALAAKGINFGDGEVQGGQSFEVFKTAVQAGGNVEAGKKLLKQKGYSDRYIDQNLRTYQKQVLGLSDAEIDEPDAFGAFSKKMESGNVTPENALSQALDLTNKDFSKASKLLKSAGFPEQAIQQMEEDYQVNVMKIDPKLVGERQKEKKISERIQMANNQELSQDDLLHLYDDLSIYEAENPKAAFRLKYKLENPEASAVEIATAEASAFRQAKMAGSIAKGRSGGSSSKSGGSSGNLTKTEIARQRESEIADEVYTALENGEMDASQIKSYLNSEYGSELSSTAINRIMKGGTAWDASTKSYHSTIEDSYSEMKDARTWPEYQDLETAGEKLTFKEKVEEGYVNKPGKMSAIIQSPDLKLSESEKNNKFENLSEEEIDQLSDDEQDKYFKWLIEN